MTRLIRWWMSKPTELKWAAAGLIAPHLIMLTLIYLRHHF